MLTVGVASPAILTSRKSFAQQALTPSCGKQTPAQMEGPFFTPLSPERTSLITPDMKAARMRLIGQVVDASCRPIAGALLDFWQCDDKGRYDNEGYRLRGHQYTNNKGEFLLETLVPGEYRAAPPTFTSRCRVKAGGFLPPSFTCPSTPATGAIFFLIPSSSSARGGRTCSFSSFCPLRTQAKLEVKTWHLTRQASLPRAQSKWTHVALCSEGGARPARFLHPGSGRRHWPADLKWSSL